MSSPASPEESGLCAPLMLELTRLIQGPKLTVEGGEKPGIAGNVLNTHCLPNTVHRQRGNAQIYSPNTHPAII